MAQDVVTKVVGATIRNILDIGVGASRALFFQGILVLVKERLKKVALRLK